MANLHYVHGDATKPNVEGNKIIFHVCNNIGAWGAGFVLAVSRRWPEPEERFRKAYKLGYSSLGHVQFVQTEYDLFVANMVAQKGINDGKRGWRGDLVDYTALGTCLDYVFQCAKEWNATLHAPKIGSALAGGDWGRIERMLIDRVKDFGVDCTIYLWDK